MSNYYSLLSGLIGNVISQLSANSSLSGVKFIAAYDGNTADNPITEATVAVGIKSAQISKVNYDEEGNVLGRAVTAKLLLGIHTPVSGGSSCYDLACRIAQAVLEIGLYPIRDIDWSEASFVRSRRSIYLPLTFDTELQ
jgi:hypothetical protein